MGVDNLLNRDDVKRELESVLDKLGDIVHSLNCVEAASDIRLERAFAALEELDNGVHHVLNRIDSVTIRETQE